MPTEPPIDAHISRTLDHLHHLSVEIGPRPSARDAERQAAEYAAAVMRAAGITEVRLEPFQSGRSTYRPYTLAIAAGLVGNLIRLIRPGRTTGVLSALLSGAGAQGFWAESNFDNNWMRRVLPTGQSHNAIGIIPSVGETKQRVVLVGHIDTHRTPIVYSNAKWLKSFSTLVGGAFVSLLAGAAIGGLTAGRKNGKRLSTALNLISSAAIAFQTLALALTVQAEATPHAHGANDNASGAATVLALGERLAAEPLQHTEVWIVNNGCEELGAYGMAALIEAHGEALRDAYFLDFDMVGIGQPTLIVREGLVRGYYPDDELIEMARQVARNNPDLLGGEHESGAYTDIGVVIKNKLRGLVIDSQVPPGHPAHERMGYWHQTADTFDKIEPHCLEKTHRFGWELLQYLDMHAETK